MLRTLVASAAVAVGIGQAAQAATHNIVFTITRAEHIYYPADESVYEVTPLDGWWGLAAHTPLKGILDIADDDRATLDVAGTRIVDGWYGADLPQGGRRWLQGDGFSYTTLDWYGDKGSVEYGADYLPDYYEADATVALAPIPVPASAALLPLGVAVLSSLRKRSRG